MRTRDHQKVRPGDILYCQCPGNRAINQNVEIKAVVQGKEATYPLFLIDASEGEIWLTHKYFTKPVTVEPAR